MNKDRLDQLTKMLEDDPKSSFILFAIAQEYQQSDQNRIAIDYYNRLKEAEPDYVGLYYHLAKCYEKGDNEPLALTTYDQGILVATKLNDQHALAELKNAKLNFELGL